MLPTLLRRKITSGKKLTVENYYRLCAKSDLTWRYIANFRPWLEYRRIQSPLNQSYERLLSRLARDGIVVTSVEELMENADLFQELEASVREKEKLLADEIQQARENVDISERNKGYFLPLLGHRPSLDLNDIFVRFALQSPLLNLVNNYFGMLTKLRYFNVWHNFPTSNPAQESQLWHRDPEDRAVLKMFVYLTEVNSGCGPFNYAPGTHLYGDVQGSAPFSLYKEGPGYVRRSNDAQMAAIVPKHRWITATGPKGTIVLADTRGYHKGGHAQENDRILYTCAFTSNASFFPDAFVRNLQLPKIAEKPLAFAIGPSSFF